MNIAKICRLLLSATGILLVGIPLTSVNAANDRVDVPLTLVYTHKKEWDLDRLTLYYEDKEVDQLLELGEMTADGPTKTFNKTSGLFHVVNSGNEPKWVTLKLESNNRQGWPNADNQEITMQVNADFDGQDETNRPGKGQATYQALAADTPRIPGNGFTISFESQLPKNQYRSGRYTGSYTLLVTPIL